LNGRVIDQTGAPFKDSRVELRVYVSESVQLPFATVTTNSEGEFDLHVVLKGDYRFLASATRAFRQPDELWCSSDAQCFLSDTLCTRRQPNIFGG
jgi:hypothetical protein